MVMACRQEVRRGGGTCFFYVPGKKMQILSIRTKLTDVVQAVTC